MIQILGILLEIVTAVVAAFEETKSSIEMHWLTGIEWTRWSRY